MLAALAFVAALAAADAPKEKEPADLQGVWVLDSTEIKGKAEPPLGSGQTRVVIDGAKILYAGEEIGSLTADAKSTPKIVDVTFLDPKRTCEGIYTVDKDTLKICLNIQSEGVKMRPVDFSTGDAENPRVLVFHREKTAPENPTEGLTGFLGLVLRRDDDRKEVVVADIIGKSAAEKAGFKKDDVVLKVGGAEVTDLLSAIDPIRRQKAGAEVVVRVRRDDKEQDVSAKVGVLPFIFAAHLQ